MRTFNPILRTFSPCLAAMLFLGLGAAVFAQAVGPNPPNPWPIAGQPSFYAPPFYVPAFKPGFGQAVQMVPTSGPTQGGSAIIPLPEKVFDSMAGGAWAVKFLVQTTVKGDFVTRTAQSPGTGQFLFGASRTTGTARAVLYPNGATPLTIDGGAGPNLADGQPHWLEVDCAAGAGGTSNYHVYGDGILAGSAVGASAWSGPGTRGLSATNPGGSGSGDPAVPQSSVGQTAFDGGKTVDYVFPCAVDELAFYTAALHTGAAFTPDAAPLAASAPHQTHLYHFDGDGADSNTNTAP